MATRGLKESVKDGLTVSKKTIGGLLDRQLVQRMNTPKKAAIFIVVGGYGIITTWMGFQTFFDSRTAKNDVNDLKDKGAEFQQFKDKVCSHLVPTELKKEFGCPAQPQKEPAVPLAPLSKPMPFR